MSEREKLYLQGWNDEARWLQSTRARCRTKGAVTRLRNKALKGLEQLRGMAREPMFFRLSSHDEGVIDALLEAFGC